LEKPVAFTQRLHENAGEKGGGGRGGKKASVIFPKIDCTSGLKLRPRWKVMKITTLSGELNLVVFGERDEQGKAPSVSFGANIKKEWRRLNRAVPGKKGGSSSERRCLEETANPVVTLLKKLF